MVKKEGRKDEGNSMMQQRRETGNGRNEGETLEKRRHRKEELGKKTVAAEKGRTKAE